MQQYLIDTVQNFGSRNEYALVIGDIMLDRYLIGDVSRISPEAPVPVLLVKSQQDRPGGAANVAVNLALLGINTSLIGCIGNDNEGIALNALIQQNGINVEGIICSKNRPTIAKTRVLGGHQQMLRLDQEDSRHFNDAENTQLLTAIQQQLDRNRPTIVVLSDYAKGLLNPTICQAIIKQCRSKNIPVLVDPKGRDFSKYQGATALTPNKKEIAEACNTHLQDSTLMQKANTLKTSLALDFLAVTLSEEGISLLDDNEHLLPAVAQQVFDVSGAGDTVIATLAAGLMHDLPALHSLELANIAAGIVVGKVGTVPITKDELLIALQKQQDNEQTNKICNLKQLMQKVSEWKHKKQTIVFTNGCFDLLHAGHVTYLEAAKKRGDKLILGLNTDRSVSTLKGPTRPVVNENDRARVLAALESINAVILFDEDTPLNLINAIQPDVIAKGSDYTAEQVVGGKEVLSWGGKIALIDLVEGRSTSNIIKKMHA